MTKNPKPSPSGGNNPQRYAMSLCDQIEAFYPLSPQNIRVLKVMASLREAIIETALND